MAKKKRKLREILSNFASSVSEAQARNFAESLRFHYQQLSPFMEDELAPDYQKFFDEVVEMLAPSEIATLRFAPEQTVAPQPMNAQERDLCETFVDAATRYCRKVFKSEFFSQNFQDAFNAAIIAHYSSFGASAFIQAADGGFPQLANFAKTVRREARREATRRAKENFSAFEFDVAAPLPPPTPYPPFDEALAFLESLRPRKYDPVLVAVFGASREGLRMLNPENKPRLKKALERERRKIRKLLHKRFNADVS